jgi:uncharacterized protein YajQ (UPF0234 family)
MMPTFDIVSEVDLHEVTNAVDQTNREIGNRFDFKGVNAKVRQRDSGLALESENEFQIRQMLDILHKKMAKRGIDVAALAAGEIETGLNRATLAVSILQGIDQDTARMLVKLVKGSKLKVQASIQGDKVRVSGKKRDDLQAVISLAKESGADRPLQFINFRD